MSVVHLCGVVVVILCDIILAVKKRGFLAAITSPL